MNQQTNSNDTINPYRLKIKILFNIIITTVSKYMYIYINKITYMYI